MGPQFIHQREKCWCTHLGLLGVVSINRKKKINKNKNSWFVVWWIVMRDVKPSGKNAKADAGWKYDHQISSMSNCSGRLYSFIHTTLQGGRQTMINAIPSGSLSFSFFQIYLFIFFCVCILLVPFHINWHLQHATPWCIFFFSSFFGGLLFLLYFRVLFAYSFEECEEEKKNKDNRKKCISKPTSKRYRTTVIFPHFPYFFVLHYNMVSSCLSLHYINRYQYVLYAHPILSDSVPPPF